jgi:transporter family protein
MNWLFWALLSAFFAALTAVLAKVGVVNVDSNLATCYPDKRCGGL